MLDFKVKIPQENSENKYKNTLNVSTSDDSRQKQQFFKNKMQNFINEHLDCAKYKKKKTISESDFEEFQKLQDEKLPLKIKVKQKFKMSPEKTSEFENIMQKFDSMVPNFERICSLISNAQRITNSIEKSDRSEIFLSKISNANQVFDAVQEILTKELEFFDLTLTLLESFHKKQEGFAEKIKKELEEKHKIEIELLKQKYQNKLKVLAQHNKNLSSKKKEKSNTQSYKEKLENLEDLINDTSMQINDKNDEIKSKTNEINSLKQTLNIKIEEIVAYQQKLKEAEKLINMQKDSYECQIDELTEEIYRLKNSNEETGNNFQEEFSQLQYFAESSKNKLEQALLEINTYAEQLDFVKKEAKNRESILENENNELRCEIERLDRIVLKLKHELDEIIQVPDKEKYKSYRNNDERDFLNSMIEKLEQNSYRLLEENKELYRINQRLEIERSRSRESKSIRSSRSERKIKKK